MNHLLLLSSSTSTLSTCRFQSSLNFDMTVSNTRFAALYTVEHGTDCRISDEKPTQEDILIHCVGHNGKQAVDLSLIDLNFIVLDSIILLHLPFFFSPV